MFARYFTRRNIVDAIGLFLLLMLLVLGQTGCTRASVVQKSASPANDTFYQSLESMQGRKVAGRPVYADEKMAPFAGKAITLEVASCTKKEMRIPIYVGDKIYRTLVLERTPNGFFLKHENKTEAGRSKAVDLYGGQTVEAGTAFMQFFPADAYTNNLLGSSSPSVWTLAFSSDRSTFTYLAESDGKLQMQIDFDLHDYLAVTPSKTNQRSKR